MNLTLRIRIIQLAVWLLRFTSFGWRLTIGALSILMNLAIRVGQARGHRRVKTLQKAVAVLQEKSNSIVAELQILGSLSDDHRQQVLAVASALLGENKHLQIAVSELRSARLPGSVVLTHALTHMQHMGFNRQRKVLSLKRISSRIDRDTFYLDLLLWLVIPSAYSEELLGDLDEEYLLRTSAEGEAGARAWYLDQVATTVKDLVWKKIERVAAIGTLIDLLGRWFRG